MTPIEGNEDYVKQQIRDQVCAADGGRVIAIYDGKAGIYRAKCEHGEYPALLKPVPSPAQEIKRSTQVMVPIGMGQCPTKDIADGKDLTPGQIQALRAFADRYGLDADRGHVYVMRNQPYIGLDGYYYHANMTGQPYIMGSRPLTVKDKALYQIPADDYAWIAELEFLKTGTKVSGLGIVQAKELTEMSKKNPENKRSPVVAEHPQLQAQKRAEWQCMGRAFPIGGDYQGGAGGAGGSVTATVELTPEQIEESRKQAEKDSKELFG